MGSSVGTINLECVASAHFYLISPNIFASGGGLRRRLRRAFSYTKLWIGNSAKLAS